MEHKEISRFMELAEIWNEAQNETLAGEAVLNQVSYSEVQALVHIRRGWRLLAQLVSRDNDASALPPDTFDSVRAAILSSDLIRMPEKDRAGWEDAVSKVFQFNLDDLHLRRETVVEALKGTSVSDMCDDLDDCLYSVWGRLKRKYGRTLLQRLHLTRASVSAIAVGAAFVLYVAISLACGSWSPNLWFKQSTGDFVILSATQQWGQLGINKSVGNNQLSIKGVKYGSGLGTHAVSKIVIGLKGKFSKLSGLCGPDDEAPKCGPSISCSIVGGGKKLFDSGLLVLGKDPARFEVPVEGLSEVELHVSDGGNGINCDHADWVDLKLK